LSILYRRFNCINPYRSEDDEDYESLSDKDINKLLIFTQVSLPSSRVPKHEGYDRTGDWTTRVKMTQELEQLINDGLFYYEQELWKQDSQGVKSYNFVHFEKIMKPNIY